MPIDPTTGMYVEPVYHTPGGGPFAGLDIYNAFQGENDYQRNLARQTMAMQGQMLSPNDEALMSNPDYQQAMSRLGISPDAMQTTMQQTPWYQARQNVQGLGENPEPEDILNAYVTAGAPPPAGLAGLVGTGIRTEAGVQKNALTNMTGAIKAQAQEMARLLSNGTAYDQAFDQSATPVRLSLAAAGIGPDDDRYKAIMQTLNDQSKKIAANPALAGQQAPKVAAQIQLLDAQGKLDLKKIQEMDIESDAKLALLKAGAKLKNAQADLDAARQSLVDQAGGTKPMSPSQKMNLKLRASGAIETATKPLDPALVDKLNSMPGGKAILAQVESARVKAIQNANDVLSEIESAPSATPAPKKAASNVPVLQYDPASGTVR